ncbi:MAG: phosphate-starvation-inducible PsiE family protein [Acidimicrobiales bacterium]
MDASAGNEPIVTDATADATPEPATTEPVPAPVGGRARDVEEPRWSRFSTKWTEHAQDAVSAVVAVTLIVMAGAILIASIVNFFHELHPKGLTLAATDLLDKVLLVLIVVEIVHTVILSLRAHALAAQPFIVVGLVAVIRKILFALGSQQKLSTPTLGLYIGMVAVFVASLVAIEVFGANKRTPGSPGLH